LLGAVRARVGYGSGARLGGVGRTGEMAAPIRVAVPVVACVASVVFLRRLRPALSAIGREATSNDGQVGLLKAAVTASRDG